MKIFLVDKYKVNIYKLPEKIEDSYSITYISPNGVEETITLNANNNKWNISSNRDVYIYKNNISVTSETLEDNAIYQIKFSDMDIPVMFYCFDTPTTYQDFDIGNKNSITLSREGNAEITYNNPYISSPHLKIYKYNNYWILEDNGYQDTLVFVNQYRVHKTVLKMGDVIFTNGLKIIWMNNFIKINNPKNNIKIALEQSKKFSTLGTENTYTPVKETEKAISLYNDNQVFFHTPRLKSTYSSTTIRIVPPPNPIKDEGPPAILTLGATIMMGLSSSITGIIAIFNVMSGKTTVLNSITEISICIFMIIGTVCFPILLDKYQKRKIKTRKIH